MPGSPQYDDNDVFESLALHGWEQDDEASDTYDRDRLESTLAAPIFPGADSSLLMPTRGFYPGKWPMGAIVHFTAGRSERGDADARITVAGGIENRYCYACISRTGLVYQVSEMSRWGSHAGKSSYPGVSSGSSVHSKLIGIEICNAGALKKTANGYEPWWNKPGAAKNTYYPEDAVRLVDKKDNILERAYYLKFTPEQEESLIEFLLWMHKEKPDIFKLDFVLGHDEVSPRRKNDPGGALSMTMPEFRTLLKQRAASTVVAAPVPQPEPVPMAVPPVAPPRAEPSQPPITQRDPPAQAPLTIPPLAGPAEPAPQPAIAQPVAPRAPEPAPVVIPAAVPPPTVPVSAAPAATAKIPHGPEFLDLLAAYRALAIEHPHLKDITFAQWAHETGYGRSTLAVRHRNFAGMKWRADMARFAHQVEYRPDHDPIDKLYCGFATLENFIRGYWHRLDIRSLPYATRNGGWRAHSGNPREFIEFIGPIWAPEGGDNSPLNNGYVRKVKEVHEKLRLAGLLPSSNTAASFAGGGALESTTGSAQPTAFYGGVLKQFYERLLTLPEAIPEDQLDGFISRFVADTVPVVAATAPGELDASIKLIRAAAEQMPPDLLQIGKAAESLNASLPALRAPLDAASVKTLLNGLRDARAFDWLGRIADRLISTGHAQPIIRRYYAQALVETGSIHAAIMVLEQLARTDLPEDEMVEVMGQLGRAHKQLYVEHVRSSAEAYASSHRYARHLRDAIRYYGEAYAPDRIDKTYWHGINLVALLRRAAADGVPLDAAHDANEIAQQIISSLGPIAAKSGDPWVEATLGEACIALGKFEDAAKHFAGYAKDNKNVRSFHLSSTIRQLEEVWRTDGSGDGADRCLLTLKAAAAGKRYAGFGITAAERKIIRGEQFETSYPDGDFIQHGLLRKIVRAGESVAWIKNRNLKGIGTGFLILGRDIAPSLGDELFLLTNTHVVCDRNRRDIEPPHNSLAPSEAIVLFEAADGEGRHEYRLKPEAVWQSPSSEYDACLLRLAELPRNVRPATIAPPDHRPDYGREEDETDGTPVAVLGHAGGNELQLGLRGTLQNHQGSLVDIGARERAGVRPVYLHYDSPTLGGNSGSPVFDTSRWEVIGLHHAGYDTSEGRARLRGRGGFSFANEGIYIHSIGEAIEAELTGGKRKGMGRFFGRSSNKS